MEWKPDALAAAERHWTDGVLMEEHRRFDNAGYHFGLAAECAVKQALLDAGVAAGDPIIMKEHFPELRVSALQFNARRSTSKIRSVLENSEFLARWRIAMRYSSTGSVDEETAAGWKEDAGHAIGELLY